MKTVVILDDSISYFTNPSHIQEVYGRFWDEGIPISLAITPALYKNTQPFKVSANDTLCRYLNVMAEQRLVEICLHGYNGTIDEFKSGDDILLGQKIEEGKAELEKALPDAEIGTFVIPEQRYSKTAKDLLIEYDFRICAPHKPSAKSDDILFKTKDLGNERKFFTYAPPIFSQSSQNSTDMISNLKDKDFIIIRQNYATFYDDTIPKTNQLFQEWQGFVANLLANQDLEFDTFMFI
ncbi:MAG: hypothetical protein Phog2KO_25690 [Phototrophicaceae bacterium]